MEKQEILSQISLVFSDVLNRKDLVLSEISNARDVEEWDSLTHIQLVIAMEKHFKVRFTMQEIQNWKNIGEIIHCISNHLNNK